MTASVVIAFVFVLNASGVHICVCLIVKKILVISLMPSFI